MISILWSLGVVYASSIFIIAALILLCAVSARARKHVFS